MRMTISLGLCLLAFAACDGEETGATTATTSTVVSSSSGGGQSASSGGGGEGGMTTTTSASAGTGGTGGAGGDGSGMASSGSGGAPPGPLTLTSSAIADMGTIPVEHTCKGADVSPPLAWQGGPATAKSYAVVFRDLSNSLLHASIWDIPAGVTSLPKGVEEVAMPSVPAGAKQSKGYNGLYGYQGPCPPNEHTYEFRLYALDIATLPNVTTSSKIADVVKELDAHQLATATLTAKFKP